MMSSKDKVVYEMQKETILSLLEKNERLDGRKFLEYRPITIQKGAIPNAEGSALVSIGNTKVLASVKFEVLEPFKDRPEDGVLIANAEFVPFAADNFEPGPPNEDSIELARVVDRGLRESGAIDFGSLFIEEGKVYGIFLDLYLLDYVGNYFDTAALAAISALLDAKIPKYEDGELLRDEFKGHLNVVEVPVTTTFFKIGNHVIIDALTEEEFAADARLTVGTIEKKLCSMQKGLGGSFKKSEVLELIDIAFDKGKELRRLALQE